jgi:hypothetical protein
VRTCTAGSRQPTRTGPRSRRQRSIRTGTRSWPTT